MLVFPIKRQLAARAHGIAAESADIAAFRNRHGQPGIRQRRDPQQLVRRELKADTQLLKGILEFCVLKLISREPTYGYEIVMNLKQVGFSDLSESTLYPLLLRLEQQGKVTVERRPSPKGPSRKYYVVTEKGRLALFEFRQDWSQLCQLVEKIFKEEPDE